MKFGIGQSVTRCEDPRLITGGGQYTDDINRPNQLYIRILRSPYAHGRITALDVSAARSRPGVEAVTAYVSMRCKCTYVTVSNAFSHARLRDVSMQCFFL